jgi:3-isopropylmalate/(R)-2-methylmalate dehydratase large subunit
MRNTIIQNIFETHSCQKAIVGDIIDISIDARVARDFGGANVVKNLIDHHLGIDNPAKTFFTFDCNPGGCDQKYAANQQICRLYARDHDIKIFDIDQGIGTHIAIDEGLIAPGGTLVSTDSHANILGAVGAFGQGMGDKDIAHAWAYGKVWFKVPPTVKIILKGQPGNSATAKDVTLCMLQHLGANGLLGYAAEIYGDYVNHLSLDGRITIASMATEMGGIIIFFPPNQEILTYFREIVGVEVSPVYADDDAGYEKEIVIDITGIDPLISQPGHPEDVVRVSDVARTVVDSGFIGSCTNGRMDDLRTTAAVLKGHRIAPDRVLKIVPATDKIWKQCLDEGLIGIFKDAGALVGSAGCAGCAAGQIGQTGKDEVEVSTGNRNFTGKQGKGQVYLTSPETVAASLISGVITTKDELLPPSRFPSSPKKDQDQESIKRGTVKPPLIVKGRAWVIPRDNIDTDMIFHNRYLSITDIDEMGQYTFDNLEGFEDFVKKVKPGDIVVVGKNFGCGSSRQQAVDCFKALGISVIIAESFGAIYERNAINNAMPILVVEDISKNIVNGDILKVDFASGVITDETQNKKYYAKPFSPSQMQIYTRGGLL